MSRFVGVLFMLYLLTGLADAGQDAIVPFPGGEIEEPGWFKHSFLELQDDLEEAAAADKKLVIYYHQAGCVYCYNLVQQVFLDPEASAYLTRHFDLIALDLWGDREVTLPDGTILPEKQLARRWLVQFTPTLLFFDETLEPVFRVDGYRNKAAMMQVFRRLAGTADAALLSEPLNIPDEPGRAFTVPAPFQLYPENRPVSESRPLLILFGHADCEACQTFNNQVLARQETQRNLKQYSALYVDAGSPRQIITPQGRQVTVQTWVEALELDYFPAWVLFDAQGILRLRINAYVQSFHFNAALEFVAGKVYESHPEFQRYIIERADRLRAAGQQPVIVD